jgi:hypothetical protein
MTLEGLGRQPSFGEYVCGASGRCQSLDHVAIPFDGFPQAASAVVLPAPATPSNDTEIA